MEMLYCDLCDGRKICREEQGSFFDGIKATRYSAIQSLLELLKARPTRVIPLNLCTYSKIFPDDQYS
jgi:hypothetical protein